MKVKLLPSPEADLVWSATHSNLEAPTFASQLTFLDVELGSQQNVRQTLRTHLADTELAKTVLGPLFTYAESLIILHSVVGGGKLVPQGSYWNKKDQRCALAWFCSTLNSLDHQSHLLSATICWVCPLDIHWTPISSPNQPTGSIRTSLYRRRLPRICLNSLNTRPREIEDAQPTD